VNGIGYFPGYCWAEWNGMASKCKLSDFKAIKSREVLVADNDMMPK
jgi:hypothetical protein